MPKVSSPLIYRRSRTFPTKIPFRKMSLEAKLRKYESELSNLKNEMKMFTSAESADTLAKVDGKVHGVELKKEALGSKLTKKAPDTCEECGESGRVTSIKIDLLHKLNQKNVSVENMKRLVRMIRYGILTNFEQLQILSDFLARIVAKKIFINVAKTDAKYIYLEDLMCFMRRDEALKTMNLFEGAQNNNKVSKRCFINWMVNTFRERKHISLTLNDTKSALKKVHQLFNLIAGAITFSLCLVILNIVNFKIFVVIGTQLLVGVFMFGNTLKITFESIIFLFVRHPYDVGDRCDINGVQMVVEEMNTLIQTWRIPLTSVFMFQHQSKRLLI